MLIGSFYHSLESKGRLAIPVSFRNTLGSKPILTQGIDTCLYLLPFNIWTTSIKKLEISPLANSDARNLVRTLAHHASQASFDSQGRILIPLPLKNLAKLNRKVVIAGSVDWVEIWDQQIYVNHQKTLQGQTSAIVDRLAKSKTS